MKHRSQFRTSILALLCLAVMAWTGIANAQLPIPASTQFDIEGFLQAATPGAPGTLTVNGHLITVPANTIVIFPANALTWQELFAQAPPPYTGVASGMALSDIPQPMSTYEVHVVGNRVLGGPGGADLYIAGLVYISQEDLNSGAGFINFMDYSLGEMRVGGTLGSNTTGARVRLNDPMGRYGRAMSPDRRFTVDPDNPTITAGTGYPQCFPRSLTDPTAGGPDDPLCPQGNRPQILVGNPPVATFNPMFTTANVTQTVGPNGTVLVPPPAGTFPDSTRQAPLEVGDYITFSGILVNDSATPTAGPWPANGAAGTYISAHTIVSNNAIFTFPGSNPAYVRTDVFLLGTGGLSILGVGEATIRTRFEGMTTDVADPSLSASAQRIIHLYGMDLAPNGTETDREYGVIGVDPGPPTGAVKGRWRFRPPCLPFGSVPTKPDKQCVTNINDTFLPATREMRSVIEGLQSQVPGTPTAVTSANGIFYGQYHAPITGFIFPENIPGNPIVENNFNTMPFLACGGYTSAGDPSAVPPVPGTLAGVLSPWPSIIQPDPTLCPGFCAAATPSATASPTTAAAGTLVTLTASSGGTAPITFTFAQNPLDVPQVVLTVVGNTATFTAPGVANTTTLNFTVTATNCKGSVSVPVTVTINGAAAPTVSYAPPAPASVPSGTPFGPFTASCTDPANLTPCTFVWRQIAGPALLNPNPTNGATIGSFTVNIPVGQPSQTYTFQVVATNTAGVSSAPASATVTVNPTTDQVALTTSVYRFGKQRLDLTATDNIVGPNVVVTLLPYLCQGGVSVQCPGGIFNPANLGNVFTNTGGGLYTLTLIGAPEPACNLPLPGGNINSPCTMVPLQVQSTLGGVSPLFPLQKTRQ